jgi:ligand-binding SRPBCC domain-containing protein
LHHANRIDGWRPYAYFREVMVEGVFERYEHEHFFAVMDDGTRMRDELRFSLPGGPLGRLVGTLVRKRLTALLLRRNATIKRVAESEEWHRYLDGRPEIAQKTTPQNGLPLSGWDRNAILRR